MKLKNMSKEEIELLSYTDLTYLMLKEEKSMTTPVVFKRICDMLSFSEDEYMNKIGDYYTSLTLDKRFVLLENNEWDIRDRHSVELIVDDEDEEIIEEDEEESEVLDEEQDENIDEDNMEDDLVDDDDMDDLTILNDDEMEDE